MKVLSFIASAKLLIPLVILTLIWIIVRGTDRFLEIRFLFITTLGGEILEEGLRLIFHRLGPMGLLFLGNIKYTFPGEQSLMTIVAYGFTSFILVRHAKKAWVKVAAFFLTLVVCIFSGLSPLFFQLQYPSDIVAGYVFGGVWLSLNIILLEVNRILPKVQF